MYTERAYVVTAVVLWAVVVVVTGLTLDGHPLMPLLITVVGAASSTLVAALLRRQLVAVDEIFRLGVEVGERKARARRRQSVITLSPREALDPSSTRVT